MNQEKIGMFIAELRKQNNMTQEQLAEKLGVTDKSISRWESGKTMPDILLLKELSKLFDVSITEILNGHKMNIKELENQKELIDKLIEYENYKESVYQSKQAKIFPLAIIGYVTLIIACRYEYKMPEVLFGMLLAVSIIANLVYVYFLAKNFSKYNEIKRKLKK